MAEDLPYKGHPITEWSVADRPRERMTLHGPATLGDAELIGILLATGYREKSAVEVARELLALAQNDLAKLSRLSQKDLEKSKRHWSRQSHYANGRARTWPPPQGRNYQQRSTDKQ